MKQIIYILAVMIVFSFSSYAQDENTINEKFDRVKYILPTIISQPDSPLKIEEAAVFRLSNGRITTLYQVKNIGDKAIADYTIARWYSDNTGTSSGGALPKNTNLLKPNEIFGTLPTFADSQKELKKENQKKGLKKIVFLMIVGITFTDGSQYSAKETFASLTEHLRLFENTYEKLDEEF